MKVIKKLLQIFFFVPAIYSISFAQIVYYTSFEDYQDTAGWQGEIKFTDNVPPEGENRSAYISGGCVVPHAWIEIGPFETNGFYEIRCWGKDLADGGVVAINVEGDYSEEVNININSKEWSFYKSGNKLFCPAGKKLVLSLSSGGLIPGGMLVDRIEITGERSGAANWVIQNSGTTETLNDVVMLDSSTAVVVGSEGSILKTDNCGLTWRNTNTIFIDCKGDCLMKFNALLFYDHLNGLAAGESILLITTDGGESWDLLNIPASNNFTCIGNIGLDNIFIGDDSGYVHNTRDTGKTWTSQKISDFPVRSIFPFRGDLEVFALYIQEIFALTSHQLFIKNAYGSDPWVEWGSLGYFQGLGSGAFKGEFSEAGTAFIVGAEGDFIYQSTIIRLRPPDSHWFSVGPSGETGELKGLSIPSPEVVYTCGFNGKILKSINEGTDWFSQETPLSHTLNSIYFFNDKTGFAVGDSGTILYTSTGGTPGSNPPSDFNLISPADGDTTAVPRSITFVWHKAVDPDNDPVKYTLLISEDSCASWKSYGPTADTLLQVHFSPLAEGRYYWTVIAYDGINSVPAEEVFAFNVLITSDNDDDDGLPDEFALFQNYPNPFNPVTTLEYNIPEKSFVTLKVYDILGKEVSTLVSEEKPAGNYKIIFNASELTSGIYLYSVKAGEYTATKKLILVK